MSGVLLSVVLPTYNEAVNVPLIVERLERALGAIPHETIVADDDSPDGTWRVASELSGRYPAVRSLRRTGERGLYPAVLEAFSTARGEYLAVLDADLQHDESRLPAMLELARARGLQLVVGSRHAPGGGIEGWGRTRRLISRAANLLSSLLLSRGSSDLMSGFFLVERSAFLAAAPRLTPKGFKILMDLLQNLPPGAQTGEVGYVFRPRTLGESKLDARVAGQFFTALAGLTLKRFTGR